MQHRNVIVTGGLGGIGQSIVQTLAARGDRIFIIDYVTAADPRVVSVVSNQNISYIQADLASSQSVKTGFDQLFSLLDQQQSSSLDILINNAGVTADTLALRMTEEAWDRVLDINLKGAFLCCQQALKRMVKAPASYIINMSSIVGIRGNAGQANYAASKAGLIALTKSLAQEYASRNVLVNAIAPGFIQTPMTDMLPELVKQKALEYIPLKRFGTPADVAHLVAFLTSGAANYITGQVIEVTGGM